MIKALKALVVTSGLILTFTVSNVGGSNYNEDPLLLDDLYACHWWPFCRDPDELKPAPRDRSAPKPSSDKDPGKDKKSVAQLA